MGSKWLLVCAVASLVTACGDNNIPQGEARVVVNPTTGLKTTESGGTDTFTVVLAGQPVRDVTIAVSSGLSTEGTVDKAQLVFTHDNWNAPQTVTVTGVDDQVADGAHPYTIVTSTTTSDDPRFSGLAVDDVEAVNEDNDSPGIMVTPPTGLVTTEGGGTATFDVVLLSKPTADVQIGLTSSDTTEGTVGVSSLTFTTDNWNAPQHVTVTGVDDALPDGAQTYMIVTAAATSSDAGYQGVNADDVTVSNTDNDTAGITVAPTTGLETTESGGTATFTIVLNAQPTADVTIPLSSSDTDEGTIAVTGVTFTTANWNAPQTVTVTGVNDDIADGDQPYTIVTGAATSTDAAYTGLASPDVAVTNIDNDSPGATVAVVDATTSEGGGQATFTIVLNSQPTGDVTIALASTDTTEGTVSPASVTFTPANWSAAQTVTVTGVNDDIADGDQVYSITTIASSADPGYDGLAVDDVSLTNIDNDSAGVTVTADADLTTTENGTTATFQIVLNSQPTGDVTIALASSDTGEGTVPASVTFTTLDWAAAQTVTITGVDDDLADGNQPFTILTGPVTSTDAAYAALDVADVAVTNIDNDSAGFIVTPLTVTTNEGGGTDTFSVVLTSQPTADVTVSVASSNTAEGTVSVSSLTFTMANWSAPQNVTVTGVDDAIADGAQQYTIVLDATSADTAYDAADPADVTGTNTDNDSPGITVIADDELTTNEGGGQATFAIVLNSEPLAPVTITLTSSNTAEGTVSPASVTFTPSDWNAQHTVTVTGVDDAIADGNQQYTIVTAAATSADPGYNGRDAVDVTITNTDDDSAGVTVSALANLTTNEGGGTATFEIVLNSQPTGDVTIALASSDTTEGTVTPSVTFTTLNWASPQQVTVTGVDDSVADGNQPYTILTGPVTSSDAAYAAIDPTNVAVANIDNDSAGFIVSPLTVTTTEGGGTGTFNVTLTSQPTANVTVTVVSSDLTEGTVSPSTLTFTASDWAAQHTVTVTGVNDDVADGAQSYTIQLSSTSADTAYDAADPTDVAATNTDNDSPGITVISTPPLTTTEAGGTTTFQIRLNSEPTADVTIALSSSNTAEGTVSPPSLTFTSLNWNAAQTVTVTGVDDAVADGNRVYSIITAPAASADAGYNELDAANVTVTNTDNDSAGITVTALPNLQTSEGGGTATFTIVLNSQPTGDVTIALSSSDTTEGTVSPASVTFTSLNWSSVRTVTVMGVNDDNADGAQPYLIITAQATSTDAAYAAINPNNVALTNLDNDSAGITVSPLSITTSEALGAGHQATFTVVLNSQPTADVTIGVSSNNTNEGTVDKASLTFTDVNWNAPQTVTVTGVDDAIQDGAQPYKILTAPATSTDTGYANLDAADVDASNTDNDSAGVTVTALPNLQTSEAGDEATFTVQLNSQPIADVTISVSSSKTTEGTATPATLTFTSANWSSPHTVTVKGVDDSIADGNQAYTIVLATMASSDPNYNGINPPDVAVTNVDNDTAGIIVSKTSITTGEDGTEDSFTVVLQSQPTSDVTFFVSSNDTTEGTVDTPSLTFTPTNWAAPQSVTVAGKDDAVADNDQPYTIVLGVATSGDNNYNGLDPANVAATNVDNDSPGITVVVLDAQSSEAGDEASFTVVLNSQPTADVTINLATASDEGTFAPISLTFTAADWAAPQTVIVTGADDAIADGAQVYVVETLPAVSTDPNYAGRNAADVVLTNVDNDSPSIIVNPTSGLVTTELGGTAQFTVKLGSQPTAAVTIPLSSTKPTEGTVAASVTLDATNWNTGVSVTVTGVNDAMVDGNQIYTIATAAATSTDTGYAGLDAANVSVTNVDDESAGITVKPTMRLYVSELGDTETFTVVLNSQPLANVTVGLTSSDTAEGTLSAASVVFTTANWNVPQTVTITGVNDAANDGNIDWTVITAPATSTDPAYNGINPANVLVTTVDNERDQVYVKAHEPLVTTESGGTATFQIRLTQEPNGPGNDFVTCNIAVSDFTEATVNPTTVTFNDANWNVPQTITVTGVNDGANDGDQLYDVLVYGCQSNDGGYDNENPRNPTGINLDND